MQKKTKKAALFFLLADRFSQNSIPKLTVITWYRKDYACGDLYRYHLNIDHQSYFTCLKIKNPLEDNPTTTFRINNSQWVTRRKTNF